MNNILTASRMADYLRCARSHYWKHEIGLRRDETSLALYIGSAWHRAMEARWRNHATFDQALAAACPDGAAVDEYTVSTIAGLLSAYYKHYGKDERKVKMLIEKKFSNTIVGSVNFKAEGKIDRVAKFGNRNVLVEYKTTGESVSSDSGYWIRLNHNSQLLQYHQAAKSLGWEIDEVVYDVVRKPSIEPKQVSERDKKGRKIVVDKNGKRVFILKGKRKGQPRESGSEIDGYEVKRRIETPEEYYERLVKDIASRPDFYFARKEVPILESSVTEFLAQRLTIARTINYLRDASSAMRKPEQAWPRNVSEQNCKFCAYSSFCLFGISVDLNNPPHGLAVKPFNPELANDTTEENSNS